MTSWVAWVEEVARGYWCAVSMVVDDAELCPVLSLCWPPDDGWTTKLSEELLQHYYYRLVVVEADDSSGRREREDHNQG